MPHRLSLVLAGLACGSLATEAAADTSERYRVNAKSTRNVDLALCYSQVDLAARGDGDTDLDFVVRDNTGQLVHVDPDDTDVTFATLRPRGTGCPVYSLSIVNHGDVYNDVTVSLTDRGPALAARTDGRDRRVAIHNHTAETFASIFFSNTGQNTWGPDRLGTDVQRARSNRTFNIDDRTGACRFDIKARTTSGREYVSRDVNVCAVSAVEFGSDYSH